MFDYIKNRAFPNITCPLKRTDGQVHNFTCPLTGAATAPDGFYQYRALFSDDLDSEIFSINFTHNIRNTNDMEGYK